MDLDEWEYLPDAGFLDYHEDGEKKIFPGKRSSDAKSVFNMNYFICPSPKSRKIIEPEPTGNSRVPNQLVPVPIPIQLEPGFGKAPEDELVKEISKVPIEIAVVPSAISGKIKAPPPNSGGVEADQDTVSQVFFKKMKENEFVDMKMDSPKSPTRGFVPQIDSGTFHLDGKDDQGMENMSSPRMKIDKETVMSKKNSLEGDAEEEVNWDGNNDGGLNIWKWSFTGIGAICSFGIAAASICILFFGSQQGNNKQQQNQKLGFQIYTDDKRIKEVVHHATKFNEAISAARGIPLNNRAHITYGGYYDGL